MRRFLTTNFVVAFMILLAIPAIVRGAGQYNDPGNPGAPVITLRVLGIDADCSIAVFRNGSELVYADANVAGGTQPQYDVFDTGDNYTVRLSKTGFYSIDYTPFPITTYEGDDELWAFCDCFYQIKVPAGVTNISVASWDWCIQNANTDWVELIADWTNPRDARLEFDFGGTHYSLTFKLDGSNPFDGMTFVNFPGVEGVTIQYCYNDTWYNLPGTFDHSTGFITLPLGTSSLRAVKDGMSYQFDGLDIGVGPYVFDVPTIPLRVLGIAMECKIGVFLNDWDTVYPSEDVPVIDQLVYYVFDTGEDYQVRLSKTGFYSIDYTPFPITTYEGNDELWAFLDCFYQVKVPDGVTNFSVASWDWCIQNANTDWVDLIADWYNPRNARIEFDFGGTRHLVYFTLDGSDPFVGFR